MILYIKLVASIGMIDFKKKIQVLSLDDLALDFDDLKLNCLPLSTISKIKYLNSVLKLELKQSIISNLILNNYF